MNPTNADREVLKSVIREAIVDALRDDPALLREAVGEALQDLAGARREAPSPGKGSPRPGAYYDIMEGWE